MNWLMWSHPGWRSWIDRLHRRCKVTPFTALDGVGNITMRGWHCATHDRRWPRAFGRDGCPEKGRRPR